MELKDGDAGRKDLIKTINSIPVVKRGSIEFIAAKEAQKIMGNEIDVEFAKENSPFKDVMIFNV